MGVTRCGGSVRLWESFRRKLETATTVWFATQDVDVTLDWLFGPSWSQVHALLIKFPVRPDALVQVLEAPSLFLLETVGLVGMDFDDWGTSC